MDRQVRHAVAPPDQRILLFVVEARELRQGHGPAIRQRHLKRAQTVDRDALLVGGAGHDIHEVDVVANLRDRNARHDGIEDARHGLRTEAEQARLVLVDADAQLPPGSSQSKLTLSVFGLAEMTAASFSAISRTSEISGPLTRY